MVTFFFIARRPNLRYFGTACMCVCVCVCLCVHVCVHLCVFVCVCMYVCICMYRYSTAGGKVSPCLTVSHGIPQITTGDIVSRQFCGNHPCLKISVIIPGRQPCPMVITEIFRNGPYYHGTQYVPWEFVGHRGIPWDTGNFTTGSTVCVFVYMCVCVWCLWFVCVCVVCVFVCVCVCVECGVCVCVFVCIYSEWCVCFCIYMCVWCVCVVCMHVCVFLFLFLPSFFSTLHFLPIFHSSFSSFPG